MDRVYCVCEVDWAKREHSPESDAKCQIGGYNVASGRLVVTLQRRNEKKHGKKRHCICVDQACFNLLHCLNSQN